MEEQDIIPKIKEAKEKTPERNFKQTFEVSINLRDVDLRGSDKIDVSVELPKGRGKDVEIGVFADGDLKLRAQEYTDYVLDKNDIQEYAKDKSKMKKFAKSCYAFIAQPDLMPIIGKNWGIALAPRGKMPHIMPPNADLEEFMQQMKNTIRIKSRKTPTVHAPVGTEDMSAEDLADNVVAVMTNIERVITRDKIHSVYCKATMGPAVKLE